MFSHPHSFLGFSIVHGGLNTQKEEAPWSQPSAGAVCQARYKLRLIVFNLFLLSLASNRYLFVLTIEEGFKKNCLLCCSLLSSLLPNVVSSGHRYTQSGTEPTRDVVDTQATGTNGGRYG